MDKVDFVITDGSVEYKHSKPRAEYETVAPLVRLNFTVADGSDPGAVIQKVMAMAVRQVEGVLTGEVKASDTLRGHTAEEAETPPLRRGRPPKIVEPEIVGFEEGNTEPEGGNEASVLTLKGDVQPLAQKVSAHLAKVDGNINKLRAVIKECGGNSLLTIPPKNWPMFIEKAKELLP